MSFRADSEATPKTSGVRRRLLMGALIAAGLVAVPVRADFVTDWNQVADVTSTFAGGPPIRARITAMAQVAVHDALNSIDPRFEMYTGVGPALPGASPDAAVAAATYTVL